MSKPKATFKNSRFKHKVFEVVSSVPRGKVVSYGQVAVYIGIPRAARQVGWTLNRMERDPSAGSGQVPWWRVVNNQGRISIKNAKFSADDQRKLLRLEGVQIAKDFTFDIEKYRFIPNENLLKKYNLDPIYLEIVASKIPYSDYFPKT